MEYGKEKLLNLYKLSNSVAPTVSCSVCCAVGGGYIRLT